jgi:hypothetical protein
MDGFPSAQDLLDWAALRYPRTGATGLSPGTLRRAALCGGRRAQSPSHATGAVVRYPK